MHNSEKEEGRRNRRTDGARERGDVGAGVVGGQRLKLHHKSHPERKHEVTLPPPSSPSTSLPLRPGLLLSPPLHLPPFSLFQCTESAPWMDQVYFILLLHVLQTAQFLHNPSFHLPFLPFSSLRLRCKAINHAADPIGKGGEKNGGKVVKTHKTGR